MDGISAIEGGLGTGMKGNFYVSLVQAQLLLKWKLGWK